jgi:hypothetical protein
MTGAEFIVLIFWVMALPWLLGAVLLWRSKRGVLPQFAFLLFTLSIAAAAFFFAPHWIGRLLGIYDINVVGKSMLFSPLGLVSALFAWPLASLFGNSGKPRP